MFPDKNKREQAEQRIQHATNRSTLRGHKPKPAARHKQNASDELALLKAKMNELSTLFNVFSKNENKEKVAIYPVVCFTDSTQAYSKRSQTKNLKQSHMCKANKNQYAKQPRASNEKFIKNLSHKKLTDHETALLAKGLKFIPTLQYRLHIKAYLETFKSLPAICAYNIYLLTQQASPTRTTLNQTGNRHHNHQWHWKAIWNAQNSRLPPSLFQKKKITFQHDKGKP